MQPSSIMKMIETHLEYRDGGVWLVGLCPGCWEHVAACTRPNEKPMTVTCANGHVLRVAEMRSEGASHGTLIRAPQTHMRSSIHPSRPAK